MKSYGSCRHLPRKCTEIHDAGNNSFELVEVAARLNKSHCYPQNAFSSHFSLSACFLGVQQRSRTASLPSSGYRTLHETRPEKRSRCPKKDSDSARLFSVTELVRSLSTSSLTCSENKCFMTTSEVANLSDARSRSHSKLHFPILLTGVRF